jgi:putative endonuclease
LSGDLEDRIQRHQQGRERTTKPYRPFILLHSEVHPDRPSARIREKYLKSGQGKEFLKRLRDGASE